MINRIASLENNVPKAAQPRGPQFREGEIFKGTVIRNYGGGEVLVVSNGNRFRARTEINLKEGEDYRFQVKTAGNRIDLSVAGNGRTRPAKLTFLREGGRAGRERLTHVLKELSAGHSIKGLSSETRLSLQGLDQFLPATIYTDAKGDNAPYIYRYFLGNGLFWESKVVRFLTSGKGGPWKTLSSTDLKGNLLALKNRLKMEEEDNPQTVSLSHKVGEAISLIEEEQLLNLSLQTEEGGLVLFLPGCPEDGFKEGELYVKGIKGSEEVSSVSMHLDFTWLGRVDMVVTMLESFVTVQLLLEDDEKTGIVTANLPALEAGLKAAGLASASMGCRTRETEGENKAPSPEDSPQGRSVNMVI